MIDDVVAVELMTPAGVKHHVITFGRIKDPVDPEALVEIVLDRASKFGLGDATSALLADREPDRPSSQPLVRQP